MAPAKRKRNERASVDLGENRPSPHRPGNTTLGQHDREADMRNDRGGRRSSRGGRGGGRPPRNERRNSVEISNKVSMPQRTTPGPMSPPAPRSFSAAQTQPQTQVQPSATTPSPAPIEDIPPPEARGEPVLYDYSHFTDGRMTLWSTTGKREIVAAGLQALDDLDTLELSLIFQELVRATLDRKISATDAGTCVKEILATPGDENDDKIDGSTLFLDCVSILADSESYDPILQVMLSATDISPTLMRQTLEAPLLQNLGLTRNTFIKTGIRQVTNLLYRQANHNLLREETEGYSKLVTELFTTSGSEPPTGEVVEDTFERVKGLIGTFDLDVGRVLDVTLDVFAAVLIKQFRFFIKFLRISSWWPRDAGPYGASASAQDFGGLPKWAFPGSSGWTTTAEDEEANAELRDKRDRAFWDRTREIGLDAFFELGGRHAIDDTTRNSILNGRAATDTRLDSDLQWIETTGTVPPSGNRVAAQLLGFKLRFYASEAREKDDALPANLIYLASLLIKIGFISLRDLYPHLWPLDEAMPNIRDARMKDIAEKERLSRPGAAKNALMSAGALVDDTLPASSRGREAIAAKSEVPAITVPVENEEKVKDTLPEPNDQKVQLLTNLLTIGALPESLFILGRFPWLPEAYPELYELLHRILHHSINKVYEASQVDGIPASDCPGKKIADTDQSSAPKGQVRRTEITPRKPLRWPFPDKADTNDGIVYRFYWDEWADNVPVCQNVDDIFVLCSTFLNLSGVNIGRDASLLSKLATIGTKSLSQDQSDANLSRWQDLLKRLLVPALSLTKSNTSVVNEIYDMLRYYSTPVRFSIYAEWFEGATSRQPSLVAAFTRARLETISTMKRISTTNLTLMARTLAKTAYANPGIAFKVALGQIQSYSNLTEVVVECAKYFTDLGYDVLIWSLMTSLGDKNRSHTRDDSALLTSRWLIALSKFAGKVFKRYSIMNPTPVLQYVNDQLYRGNATDLIILEELIGQMSGVVSDIDFTDSQLLAMTGGELLRRQTLIRLKDRRFESTKTARNLMRSLIDTKLAGELLISIAQHRQSAIYAVSDEDAHIKYLATMVDETQRILVQYLDLLRSNLSVEQFDALVPSTSELMAEFGLDPSLAFLIGRASYAHRMTVLHTPSLKENLKDISVPNGTSTDADDEGDVTMKIGEPLSAEDDVEEASLDSKLDIQLHESLDGSVTVASPTSSTDSWQEALMPLIEAVQTVLPERTWRMLSPEFYVVFWQLSLSDILGSLEPYSAEQGRLILEMKGIMNDRTDMSRLGMARKDESKRILEKTNNELTVESKKQIKKYSEVKSRLNKYKSEWFKNTQGNDDELADALLQACFLPRLLLSPSDAIYCFTFIKILHKEGFPHFRTLAIYVHLFRTNRLRSIIFACTIREAENFGRFLKQILGDLAEWHASKITYENEALGKSRDRSGFAAKISKDEQKSITLLEFEDFRRQLYRFHKSLCKALHDCLSGTEWMHIRNAITVLKCVIEYFPVVDFLGNSLKRDLENIAQREQNSREDLSLLANALMPELVKRQSKWVIVQAFATNLVNTGEQRNSTKLGVAEPTVAEAPAVPKSALKPTAPEFRPLSQITSNGASTPMSAAINDVEDGEVDDAKALASAQATDNTETAKHSISSASSNNPLVPATSSVQDLSTAQAFSEQVTREDTPKLALNKNPQPLLPVRSDISRNSIPSVLEKPHPGLPSRPDVPFPSHITPDRHLLLRQGDRRDAHQGRVERPGDTIRDRTREPLNMDRRAPELPPRDIARPGDRSTGVDRDRDRHDSKRRGIEPFRDIRDGRDSRDHRDRGPLDNSRLHEVEGRVSRNDDMQPSRLTTAESNSGAPINSDPPINPARAAQIFGAVEQTRPEPARAGRDEHRDRPLSRAHSPRRDRFHGAERDHVEARRNDRPPSGRPSYGQEYTRGRHDEPQPGMAGSRGDWASDRSSFDRSRDMSAFQPNLQASRSLDPDHGRLNQSSRSQADPNFGRLNPAPASQIPSGPSRDRSNRSVGGSNRTTNTAHPRFDARPSPQELARPPTPDKQPPTGPAASRPPRRTGPGILEPPTSGPLPTTTTPATSPPTSGVHPERLKHIEPIAAQQAESNAASQAAALNTTVPIGVHPSRLQAFKEDNPQARQGLPPIQTSNATTSAPRPVSPTNPGPPSGPRGLQSTTNNVMSPNGITPPTGPSSTNDRNQRTTLRQIQNTINQAGHRGTPERLSERGTNIRGRSSRNSLAGPASDLPPSSLPSTPIGQLHNRDGASNGLVDRGRDLINPEHPVDLFPSRALDGAEHEWDRERDRGESRSAVVTRRDGVRSGRHSRRASRSRSPVRDAERERERDRGRDRGGGALGDGGRGEYRDRGGRGGPGPGPGVGVGVGVGVGAGDGRDLRHSERDLRRRDGEKRGDGRDLMPQTRNEVEWNTGGAVNAAMGGGGVGPGPGGPRRDMRSSGDLRRDARSDGSGRKRRGEDGGMGSDIRGHDKRPRR